MNGATSRVVDAGRVRAAQQGLARGIGLVVAVVVHLGPRPTFAQSGQVQVSYDVEFSTTGAFLSGPGVCTAAVGFDKLSGTIMGFEPAPAHEDNSYEGVLKRDTQLTFCYVATDPNAPDQARNSTPGLPDRDDTTGIPGIDGGVRFVVGISSDDA